ncbi:hypothetical protein SASPL_151600 [Salvia splendens]|uniref:2-methoxy-6-polyprenyl-1,4-benzoquinol methylase, mitochondrial n=1 Tax=Salvia splendens TaxID=180675 RepID=A0A8X8Z3J1_SALSN|nr:hypothetical protein SASPL_151600 [Salvia splendens]
MIEASEIADPSPESSAPPSSDESEELQRLEHAPPFWQNKRRLSKQLSMCELPRNIAWERRRRRRFVQQERRRTEDLTDEDLHELKGCIELGFGFDEENGQRLCMTLPALDLYFAVNRQFVTSPISSPGSNASAPSPGSEGLGTRSSSCGSDSDSWKICNPGFKEVREDEKSQMVGNVFTSVASSYDVMNDLMSGGLHRLWKERLVSKLNPFPGMKHLDVAGGTGEHNSWGMLLSESSTVSIALHIGLKRAQDRGLGDNKSLVWVEGDAEKLTFGDATMDGYTIAFGIRNVTHIEKALAEAYRVLKPGGRFLCLELSHVELPIFKDLYDYYSFAVIPKVGELVAGDRESYQYLVESIRRFPKQEKFAKMIEEAGFQKVEYENLMK